MAERIVVIGVGPDGDLARPVPEEAATVAAGWRHLESFATDQARIPVVGNLDDVLAGIRDAAGTVAVIASGDPGWFGMVRRLAAEFGSKALRVHPAPSSTAGVFARLGMAWEDATVVSAHGRPRRQALACALARPKVAVLTAPDAPPRILAEELRRSGIGPRRVVVASRLGMTDETIVDTDINGACGLDADDPNVVVFIDAERLGDHRSTLAHGQVAAPWALPVDRFDHRDGQISKPAVRALALAHLGAGPGRLLWDIGCGSGSVAIEAAKLGAGVVALDRDPAQTDRCAANARAHGVSLGLLTGAAPAVLSGLPDPDGVFIGGGGPDLHSIVEAVSEREATRLVLTLATVERLGPAMELLGGLGWETGAQQVAVSDVVELAGGHRLAPQNPVFIVCAERGTGDS